MRPQLILRAFGLLVLLSAPLASAQDLAPSPANAPPPITLVFAEGRVETVRASGVQPAQVPDLLDDDDRVVTNDGRAELAYADGTVVHLDRASDVRVDPGMRLRLVRGRAVIHIPRDGDPVALATPAGVAQLQPDGEYDVVAADLDGDTVITALAGRAVLEDGDLDVPIAADDELRVDPRDRRPRWARAAAADTFRHWSHARLATATRLARDQDLPAPLVPYADRFAGHGQWSTVTPYGAVWFPAAAGWRPYGHGSWRYTRYGWTWLDRDSWAWPVHHFGRWGRHDTRGWFWIPQRTWGPAWVGWAMGADHVAWSPLGWDARPVVDFFAGARVGPLDVWANSWSILPRRNFGHRGPVDGFLEDPRRLPGPVLGGFVSQMIGPRGPAGVDGRYAPRPGRGPAQRRGVWPPGDHNPSPRGPLPPAFGSTVPSRPAERRDPGRAVGGPAPRTEAPPRTRERRPSDARPSETDGEPGRALDALRERPQPAGSSRGPDSIRPRYEPPGAATTAPAAEPPAPARPREHGQPAGGRRERGGAEGQTEGTSSRGVVQRGGGAGRGDGTTAPPQGGAADGNGNRRRPRGSGQ